MKLTGPKVLALTLLVAGHVVLPSLGGAVPNVDAATFIPGSSQYQAVAPARLASHTTIAFIPWPRLLPHPDTNFNPLNSSLPH